MRFVSDSSKEGRRLLEECAVVSASDAETVLETRKGTIVVVVHNPALFPKVEIETGRVPLRVKRRVRRTVEQAAGIVVGYVSAKTGVPWLG